MVVEMSICALLTTPLTSAVVSAEINVLALVTVAGEPYSTPPLIALVVEANKDKAAAAACDGSGDGEMREIPAVAAAASTAEPISSAFTATLRESIPPPEFATALATDAKAVNDKRIAESTVEVPTCPDSASETAVFTTFEIPSPNCATKSACDNGVVPEITEEDKVAPA